MSLLTSSTQSRSKHVEVIVTVFDSWPEVTDSISSHSTYTTTLGKRLTLGCLYYQSVQYGTGHVTVMLCGREDNCETDEK